MSQQPRINGISHGWAEIVASLAGINRNTFTAINYKDSVERGKLRGTSMRVLGKTGGVHDNEADFEMGFAEGREFIKALGNGFMKKRFHIVVSYSDDDGTGDNPSPTVITDEFDAKIKEISHSHSQGTEPLKTKFSLDVIGKITYDRLDPLGDFTR